MGFTLALLLTVHFVADFLLQSREMGKKKSSELEWLAAHCSIHLGLFTLILTLFFGFWSALAFSLLNALIHGAIDWYIWRGYKYTVHERFPDATPETFKFWEDSWFFHTIGLDQLLHGLTLVTLAALFL